MNQDAINMKGDESHTGPFTSTASVLRWKEGDVSQDATKALCI